MSSGVVTTSEAEVEVDMACCVRGTHAFVNSPKNDVNLKIDQHDSTSLNRALWQHTTMHIQDTTT